MLRSDVTTHELSPFDFFTELNSNVVNDNFISSLYGTPLPRR